MTPAIAKRFQDRAIRFAGMAIDLIDDAERRGRFTDSDEEHLQRLERSTLPSLWESYALAVQRNTGSRPRTVSPPTPSRRPGMSVKVVSDEARVWLYGTIGRRLDGVIDAVTVEAKLNEVGRDLPMTIHLHSDGGDFFESIAIYSMLRTRRGKVTVVVDGLAASGASVIAMAADEVVMSQGSWLMIHGVRGRLDDADVGAFETATHQLHETNRQLVDIYLNRWRGTREGLEEALRRETWLSDREAVEMGLADRVSSTLAIAAHLDHSRYREIPQMLMAAQAGSEKKQFNLRRAQFRLWQMMFES